MQKRWWYFSIFLTVGFLLYLLSPILMPFVVALFLAYLGDPLVDKLELKKVPRTLAVTIVFLSLFFVSLILLLILVPLIQDQIQLLMKKLPHYLELLNTWFAPMLQNTFGTSAFDMQTLKAMLVKNWQQTGGVVTSIIEPLLGSSLAIIAFVANLVLIPVVTFYLLRDWDVMVAQVHQFIPRHVEPKVVQLSQEVDEVLGAFLRGQLSVMLALGSFYALGLWIAGLELAFLVGMLAGVVSFVPYLGFIVGIVVAGLAMYFQTQELISLWPVIAVFGIGQVLESVFLTPLLVGDRIGLHPVLVIFAVMAGGQLFGFVGVLVALPVAAVLAVFVRHVADHYFDSPLYDDATTQLAKSSK